MQLSIDVSLEIIQSVPLGKAEAVVLPITITLFKEERV
jgi:hypothetical protein